MSSSTPILTRFDRTARPCLFAVRLVRETSCLHWRALRTKRTSGFFHNFQGKAWFL